MTEFVGRKANVGIGKESVRGTAVEPDFWVPKMALTADDVIEQAIDESSVSIIEDSIDASVTEKASDISLEGVVGLDSIGLLLLAALGDVATSVDDPESGVNTHDFSVLQSAEHPSMSIEVIDDNVQKAYPLAMLDSLEISAALNEYLQFTSDWRAKVGEAASSVSAYTEETKFVPQHLTFKHAADLAGLGAGTEAKIRSLTLTINKNVEDDQVLGSVDPENILNKQLNVELTVELLYRDTTFIDFLLGDTKRAVRITAENADVTIGAATNPLLEFDLAKVSFSEVTKPYANDDIVVQTITGRAHYDISDAAMITAKLINTIASY